MDTNARGIAVLLDNCKRWSLPYEKHRKTLFPRPTTKQFYTQFPIRVLRVETSLFCHRQPETPCIRMYGGRGNEVRSLFIARPVYSAFNLHRDKYRLAETTDLCPLADRKGERGTGTGGCRGWWRWKRRIERDTKAWRDQHFS